MGGAVYALIVNACVALLFATSLGVIALMFRQSHGAKWFAISYLVGALTPISELAVRFTPWTTPFMLLAYASFLAGILLLSVALVKFDGRHPSWRTGLGIVVAGLAIRIADWNGVRGTLRHELLYQLPLAAAMGLAARTAFSLSRKRGLSLAMPVGVVFAVIALHFPIKAFVATAFGSGTSARDYAGTTYALISQATMAILLVNAGLMVLLLVAQDAMATSLYDAETDPLTHLHNRRGFFRRTTMLVEQVRGRGSALAAIMFDLDHFKRVNDTYGHATGDAVLRAFADCLRTTMPEEAIIGRLGGEEFAVLLPLRTMEGARLVALAVAAAMREFPAQALPAITVSGGLAEYHAGDDIDDLIGRADVEAYAAKAAGRDRLHPAAPSKTPEA